jgi:hypothetical protein
MKKNNLLATILVALFFLAGPASAGPPKDKAKGKTKIAILELKAERGLDEGLVKLLNELLLTEFGRSGEYEVIGGSDLLSLLQLEEKKQAMDCDDIGCLSELGGALGVDKLAAANIGKIGSYYLVNVKIINVREAKVERRVSYNVQGIEDKLIRAISASVKELMTGKPATDLEDDKGASPGTGLAAARVEGKLEPKTDSDPYSLWGHVTFWGGVGAVALGGAAMGLSASAAGDYEAGDLGAEDTSKTWAGVMYAGFGLGAALITTGVLLWLLGPDEKQEGVVTTASVIPDTDGGGVVLSIGWSW